MSNKPTCFIVAAVAFAFTAAAPAHAQNTRSWVSGTGDDINNCSRTTPCKTFSGAISKTLAGGEINCLDPAGYGALTITKSITVDCHDTVGAVLVTGGAAITINLDSAPNMIVRLRNLNLNGVLSGTKGVAINGSGANAANNAVSIEDCTIDGFTEHGIFGGNSKGGRLLVRNTTVRNNFGTALAVAATTSPAITVATLDNVSVFDSNNGFAFGNGVQAIVKNSVSTGHSTAGVELDPGAVVTIASSTISGNGTGIIANVGATVRVRDSDIVYNTTGFAGTIQSYVNNGIFYNGSGGTLVPVAGGVTNPQGLQ
jgi:hypothetical protein